MFAQYPTRILGRKQIAAALDVHPVTVSRWAATGVLPLYRVGARLEADARALAAFRVSRPVVATGSRR